MTAAGDSRDTLTSVEAAEEFKCDPATTRKAAGSGRVYGAKQESRPGTINPPWVATRDAWETWNRNRAPAGRPTQETLITEAGLQAPLLSRADTTVITRAEWVPDPKDRTLYWWTVWTDKIKDTAFRVVGVQHPGNESPTHPWGETKYPAGKIIRLGDLSFCPVPTGIMAYAESEHGIVLATIGRIRDQLEPHCGPMVYLLRHCKTRDDTVDPSEAQMGALESALGILVTQGVKATIASLKDSGLFMDVFPGSEGCPFAPGNLPDGVFEWR